ncbi:MAG: response regulator, partial [Candidatus Eremiobacterota bacterium]
DIVITDQTMPDMTGTELIKEFFSVRPDIPVILVTGYNDFITCEEIRDMGFRGFLKKPFHFQELNNIIMGILDR